MCFSRGNSVRRVLFLSLALLSLPALASEDWKANARRDYTGLEKRMSSRKNGEMAGIWGAAATEIGGIFRTMRFKRHSYRNEVDYAPGGAPVEYLVTRTSRKVSPLVIYFPGVFNDATDAGGLMAARQFRRVRNHVLVLPNPWGKNFQAAYPNFQPGDFDREARAMVDLIRDGIAFIGKDRISEIHLFGESYGGFLATATADYLNRGGEHHVKTVTSVSVPFHIGNAIGALDKMADENENAYFDGGCALKFRNFFQIIGFAFELIRNPLTSEIYAKNGVACSNPIFTYMAFEQPLFALAKSLAARRHSAAWDVHPESYWNRKIRFHDLAPLFFGTTAEEILNRDAMDLAYWVKRLREGGTQPLAMIAKDDPVNPPPGIGSYKVIESYRPGEIMVLTQGGHLGFRGLKQYRKLLRHQFRISKSVADEKNASDDAALSNEAGGPDDALDNDAQVANDVLTATDPDDAATLAEDEVDAEDAI